MSSWDKNKERSNYHFDPTLMHPLYDTVDRVGHIDLSRVYHTDLKKVIDESSRCYLAYKRQ